MPKTPTVPFKVLQLMAMFRDRAQAHVREDDPEVGVFWATCVHSLFTLAMWMNEDGQIDAETFSEAGKHESAARRILKGLGPHTLGAADIGGSKGAVLGAYQRFLEEMDTGAWGM